MFSPSELNQLISGGEDGGVDVNDMQRCARLRSRQQVCAMLGTMPKRKSPAAACLVCGMLLGATYAPSSPPHTHAHTYVCVTVYGPQPPPHHRQLLVSMQVRTIRQRIQLSVAHGTPFLAGCCGFHSHTAWDVVTLHYKFQPCTTRWLQAPAAAADYCQGGLWRISTGTAGWKGC